MRAIFLFTLISLLGCQASPPKFETRRPETVTIVGYDFEKRVAKDTFGSKWKLIELRPKTLPYQGEIAKLSAQERWQEIFKVLSASIESECRGKSAGTPRYHSDQTDFAKMGSSVQTPKYAQARFKCP